ncbi:IS3 family transposase [Rhodococcus sp. KBS0724]|uniref:IS3 family transposase n=1 Tax=Rhodococcus sp. KBS0724 TaxID=1179674 RepID=UPI00110E7BE3|nr:IS3 family transposase [Rhodococcus sp. KBS0724]TSD40528.1 IS3 family transposase [Rhodococcus sp. KBS0724]
MKVRAVVYLKAQHRLDMLLEVSRLAWSTFFYHQTLLSNRDPHAELNAAITAAFRSNHGRYRYRRIHLVLVHAGWQVTNETVLTLIPALGLICRVRQKKKCNSYRTEVGKVAPNVLDRNFSASAPNQKWVNDVTEFCVGNQKLYLSPLMDLFDREDQSPTRSARHRTCS